MKVLSKKTLEGIRKSIDARNRLAYEFGVTARTIDNYIDDNNPLLTSATALIAIREELNIDENEPILEDQE